MWWKELDSSPSPTTSQPGEARSLLDDSLSIHYDTWTIKPSFNAKQWYGETFLNCGGLANIFQAHPRGSCRLVPHLDKHVVPFLDKFIWWEGGKFSLAELADSSQVLRKLPCHTPSPLHTFNQALDGAERTQTLEPERPELKFWLSLPSCVAQGSALHLSEPPDCLTSNTSSLLLECPRTSGMGPPSGLEKLPREFFLGNGLLTSSCLSLGP
ncbi:uncharacterized protein LOC116660862 [Camelus ferus]|uniref:Uncharacterized protein LOC116660862 n=1 Tax=Camelus ferus TaxID=419612 RepID=A0A8B8SBG4_CAMFR|nr:uncharacterized protein LOC116660862 [Camelus ferus]